jgi:hypothetical protein
MESLLQNLLESCSLEEIEHYLSALRGVRQALERAREQGTFSQEDADMLLSKWLTE